MRIRFMLRRSRVNRLGMCPIEYHIRINSIVSTRHSTGIFVHPSKWDADGQRIKGNSDKTILDNRSIERISFEVNQLYDLHRAKLVFLSAKELMDLYLGKSEVSCNFEQACQKRIEYLRSKGRSEETIKIHARHHRYFRGYLKENLDVKAIVKRHVKGFWSHLRNFGYKNDVANKIVMNVKGLFIYCEKEELIDKNPFNGIGFEWENVEDHTHLTQDEINAIRETQWTAPVQRVADNFLFMCYTGLHITDYRNLSQHDIVIRRGRTMIKINRQKTGKEALIPIHEEAQKIIDKYGSVSYMPKLSGKTSNMYLKVIGEKIGTSKVLTNKIARKTFTDLCLNKYRFSKETVAAMLGHNSTKYVEKYGTVRDERILTEWKDKVESFNNDLN